MPIWIKPGKRNHHRQIPSRRPNYTPDNNTRSVITITALDHTRSTRLVTDQHTVPGQQQQRSRGTSGHGLVPLIWSLFDRGTRTLGAHSRRPGRLLFFWSHAPPPLLPFGGGWEQVTRGCVCLCFIWPLRWHLSRFIIGDVGFFLLIFFPLCLRSIW